MRAPLSASARKRLAGSELALASAFALALASKRARESGGRAGKVCASRASLSPRAFVGRSPISMASNANGRNRGRSSSSSGGGRERESAIWANQLHKVRINALGVAKLWWPLQVSWLRVGQFVCECECVKAL